MPHPPQLSGSDKKSVPGGQLLVLHVPWSQIGAATPQTFPHVPQCCGSEFVLMHAPPQFVVPAGQPLHVPWLQIGDDAGQTFPQAPQLCESEFTAVHVPLQQAADVGQQA